MALMSKLPHMIQVLTQPNISDAPPYLVRGLGGAGTEWKWMIALVLERVCVGCWMVVLAGERVAVLLGESGWVQRLVSATISKFWA